MPGADVAQRPGLAAERAGNGDGRDAFGEQTAQPAESGRCEGEIACGMQGTRTLVHGIPRSGAGHCEIGHTQMKAQLYTKIKLRFMDSRKDRFIILKWLSERD